ncbi:hypothetical protein ANANG_G00259000 [Anguilla anguilla]|uniref:Uncharacterized protein n=1 Tax=Anguilla anguilla TaxID=7936 RepID=A0A9D3LPP5_ANGAN|nr:hypothetical protein ANANG_G00259000 [Anguilla anguilla]
MYRVLKGPPGPTGPSESQAVPGREAMLDIKVTRVPGGRWVGTGPGAGRDPLAHKDCQRSTCGGTPWRTGLPLGEPPSSSCCKRAGLENRDLLDQWEPQESQACLGCRGNLETEGRPGVWGTWVTQGQRVWQAGREETGKMGNLDKMGSQVSRGTQGQRDLKDSKESRPTEERKEMRASLEKRALTESRVNWERGVLKGSQVTQDRLAHLGRRASKGWRDFRALRGQRGSLGLMVTQDFLG